MHDEVKSDDSEIRYSGLASLLLFLIRRRFIWIGTIMIFVAFSGIQIAFAPKAPATYKVTARLVSDSLPEPLKSSISFNLDQLILLGSSEPAVLEEAYRNSGMLDTVPGQESPEKIRNNLLDSFIGKKLFATIDATNPGGILISITSADPNRGKKFLDDVIIDLDAFLRKAVASKVEIIQEAIDAAITDGSVREREASIEEMKFKSYQAKLYAEQRIPLLTSYSMPTVRLEMPSWKRTMLKSMITGLLVGLLLAFVADSFNAVMKLIKADTDRKAADSKKGS